MIRQTLFERRLRSEWATLQELAHLNPGRLTGLLTEDMAFSFLLHGPSVPTADGTSVQDRHAIRVEFPVHFPAAPMELYLRHPVQHPNIHPETGFVCLWEQHRVSYTIEHALHRTAAMLAGQLYNPDALHVMQPGAAAYFPRAAADASAGLHGIDHSAYAPPVSCEPRRRRLL